MRTTPYPLVPQLAEQQPLDPVSPSGGLLNQHHEAERSMLLHLTQIAEPSIATELIPMACLIMGLLHHCSPTMLQDVVHLLSSVSQQQNEVLAEQGLDPPLEWVLQGEEHMVPGQTNGSSQQPFL